MQNDLENGMVICLDDALAALWGEEVSSSTEEKSDLNGESDLEGEHLRQREHRRAGFIW